MAVHNIIRKELHSCLTIDRSFLKKLAIYMRRDRKFYFNPDEPLKDRNWTKEERDFAQEQRLQNKYGKRRKYKLVWDVEEAWTWLDYYADFDWLFELLQGLVVTKARSAAKNWGGLRIPAAEFESVFWEEALRIADSHSLDDEFLLYETLELSIKRRTVDLARKFGYSNQERFEREAASLQAMQMDLPDWRVDVGESVTDKLFLQQLLTDPDILLPDERELLQIRLYHPHATLRDLAVLAGYSKDKVSRIIARGDAKVRQECPDLFHRISFYSTGKKSKARKYRDLRFGKGDATAELPDVEPQPTEFETAETAISD
ncbi:hypothetical protein ACPUYX_05595 [Desulfosporosinus sp. SYSU MS00001]|uniref:hypothetical protein n=1 Tax=Desulfosporosinus sp. SYSU MS00001 TaxID=3416284 RepID=UPI003CE995ED